MQRRFIPELDRRETVRITHRVPCSVMVNGDRHSGVVRDLSARGLFVEIPATLAVGTAAVVAFQ
ncbi:MAG TPA: PilZ domain-containing protein, partial [Myxococcota bacterium]|nr:PilZ domain-containing protein [Myxococcota bacterium]